MNKATLKELVDKSLVRENTFPEILATLMKEGVESYHVDFLRNEYTYYARDGGSFVMDVALIHGGPDAEFSAEKVDAINKRVQAGQAGYPDFVKEGPAAGCAYYIVYVYGKKVRYFGRDGGEHIQYLPDSK